MRKSKQDSKARVALQVRQVLARNGVTPTDRLVVGFSGGVDSLALALCVKTLGNPAVLAHLDHGLRAESAGQVGEAEQLARRMGLPFVCRSVDVAALGREQGLGLEDAGRQARYAFFAELREAQPGRAWLVLGHQADDLAEDILLRLVRGAGWPALGGMREADEKRWLVRPLLYVPRAELEALVAVSGLTPVDDSSNASLAFRRNRLRHTVLPRLQEENPALTQAVRRLHEQARLDEAYWDSQLAPLLGKVRCVQGCVEVSEELLHGLHPALRLRLYRRLLALLPGAGQARADTLFALDGALCAQQRPKTFQFAGRAQAMLAQGLLVLSIQSQILPPEDSGGLTV